MPSEQAAHWLAHFRALDAFLITHQALWRPRPFMALHLPWETEYPDVSAWLRARSLDQADELLNESAPEQLLHWQRQAEALCQLPALAKKTLSPITNSRLNQGVPGRKWQQIEAFAQHLVFDATSTHWLDWCSGKGHLGRYLAQQGQALTCLEYDAELVSAGSVLSQRHAPHAQHHLQDVLANDVARHLTTNSTPVALHACGDLHVRLLQQAQQANCTQLAIAPCCYNRISTDAYQPISAEVQRSALQLSRDDLSLPLSETVTAGQREQRLRNQSMAWRLAFDLIQRQLRQSDDYWPTPSLSSTWLKRPFAEYIQHLAQYKGLDLPSNLDYLDWEQRGWQRLTHVRQLETVRHLFRRPLELWLVLDRVLYLCEANYQVQLGEFCPHELTPRNLLIVAQQR